jgi:hypothetical protein
VAVEEAAGKKANKDATQRRKQVCSRTAWITVPHGIFRAQCPPLDCDSRVLQAAE